MKRTVLIISIILIIASILRFPYLHVSPPELFGDEIDMAYQAYTLLKTGRDMYGQVLPVYIHSLSEWLVPLLMYMTVPSLAAFGPTQYGTRFPEALFGVLGVVILMTLVYQTTRNKKITLATGFVLATMPWHVHFSRSAFGVVIMLDLGLLGTVLYLRKKFVLAAIMFALSLYAYSTAWLFVPIWGLVLMLLTRFKPSLKSAIVFMVFIVPLAVVFSSGIATRRINSINATTNPEIYDQIVKDRNETSGVWSKVFINRPLRIVQSVANNYLASFSTQFLFINGDPNYRQNMQLGELFPITFPLLLLGLYWLIKKKLWLWIAWVLLSPLPANITLGGGWHATRLFWMTPALAVMVGAGAVLLWESRLKIIKISLLVLLGIGIFQMSYYSYYYLHLYPKRSWQWWQVGFQEIMPKVVALAGSYQAVYINNSYEPALPRFLLWGEYSPKEYLRNFKTDEETLDIVPGYDGFRFGTKYYFGTFNEKARARGIANYLSPGNLYLLSSRDDVGIANDWRVSPPAGIEVKSVTTNPYNEPIFYLVEKHDP